MTAIELAAIASAAVPGLNVTAFGPEPDDGANFCSALLVDSENRRWRVRSPRHAEASTRLETERQVLRAFSPAIRAELPFLLPTVAGTVRQGELITFVYSHIAGKAETVDDLATGSATLALEIGRAIAAIHDLPQELVTTFDLPSYTANEFRQRKLNELDQAATTGKIPPSLLRRWEHAMEDVALWRFNSCVVHGDLHEDNILLDGDAVSAVIGWTDLRVGDPADDFAWLVAVNDPDFVDTVMQAYAAARNETPDPHLLRRAALSAEFALAQWLVKGYAADSARMVEDAESMLRTLEADIAEHGGQPISIETAVAPAAPAEDPAQVPPVEVAAPAAPVVVAAPVVQVVPVEKVSAAPIPETADRPAAHEEPKATDDAVAAAAPAEAGTESATGAGTDAALDSAEATETSEKDSATAESGDSGITKAATEDVDTTAMKVIPLEK
ncbi:aminoglycoside phosphotransferase [Arthrobacter sp. PAMC 25486]|uniref:macrolide 2'-phosphotransferase n=1 Tax=Arthrobacter sp. PAMC 25486 TaxID=1494608 RepID=UPI000536135F|nr:macrolide 2'-phosphotransferase [Arthrobacter sp. PAMC 25486]AIY01388.1 aminoglycoside phosphotransferase [Arthrobacter sp. PAMC 25486]